MALQELDLQTDYRSGRDALLDDFYIPCLQESVLYDRAVGYFSSTLLQMVALAYSDFVRRGGRMRLICSPALTPEDFEAMKTAGEIARHAQSEVRRDLHNILSQPNAVPPTRLLATLISNGIVEVRIAFAENPQGIFHDKLGIFEDTQGRRISFVGSANETFRAWGMNHESFEVFCSWREESELYRTRTHSDTFFRLWRGVEPGVRIEELETVTRNDLLEIAESDLDHAIESARLLPATASGPAHQLQRDLMDHQLAVLESWAERSHRGIVNFATGAGKTITAIEGIRRWSAGGGTSVVLVPGKELHKQWAQEIKSTLPAAQVLLAGAGSNRANWVGLLPVYTSRETGSDDIRVVLATNAIFASPDFQRRLNDGPHMLVVADEMHRAGSAKTLAALEVTECGATLGLSATYSRQFDETGTDRLIALFGEVLEPVVGLADALFMRLLVPYDYRLHELTPDPDEIEKYQQYTKQIGRLSGSEDSDERLRMLLIERSRILKKVNGKVPLAAEVLRAEYRDGDRWLVYCDDLEQLREMLNECLKSGLPALEFYSGMPSDRHTVLKSLGEFGGIVIAIRCLDEGIDIPVTDHALILASSTVQREYVQRRGRVLRRSPGKVSAEIHDLMLVDENGGALTKGESMRALEFARLARNEASRQRLKAMIALSSDPVDLPEDFEEEEEDEGEGVE